MANLREKLSKINPTPSLPTCVDTQSPPETLQAFSFSFVPFSGKPQIMISRDAVRDSVQPFRGRWCAVSRVSFLEGFYVTASLFSNAIVVPIFVPVV